MTGIKIDKKLENSLSYTIPRATEPHLMGPPKELGHIVAREIKGTQNWDESPQAIPRRPFITHYAILPNECRDRKSVV